MIEEEADGADTKKIVSFKKGGMKIIFHSAFYRKAKYRHKYPENAASYRFSGLAVDTALR